LFMAAEPEPERSPGPVLSYAQRTPGDWGLGMSPRQKMMIADKMTPWAFWVAGLWGAMVLGMAGLAVWFGTALAGDGDWTALIWLIAFVVAMLLSEAALLFIPVRVSTRRPVVRRSLWPSVIAAGFLFALLLFAGAWATLAAWKGHEDSSPVWDWAWLTIPCAGAIWLGWAVFFLVAGRRHDPPSVTTRTHEYLIHGSALELLVAVSAHVIVRNRGDCCAQIITLFGIATGVSVMLVAFGPAVLILVYRRCQSLKPRKVEVVPADHPEI
jgi:NADH:ubiquinone oxidoreductase subunit K